MTRTFEKVSIRLTALNTPGWVSPVVAKPESVALARTWLTECIGPNAGESAYPAAFVTSKGNIRFQWSTSVGVYELKFKTRSKGGPTKITGLMYSYDA